MSRLAGQRIVLGISAGIAAYKSAVLARLLKKAGADVRVVMTPGAQAFITPLTLQALTGEEVRTSLLDPQAEAGMGHIELAKWADIVLIAPATADLMARLAAGMADDLLTTLCLATRARCLLAPAMNQAMWSHPASQRNAATLQEMGWQQLGPDAGEQACGDVGGGRMLEPEDIVAALEAALSGRVPMPGELPLDATPEHDDHAPNADAFMAAGNNANTGALAGRHVVITAGPTREAIDPVRYLSNHSSGKMGFALACAARDQGARVTLIAGPVTLPTPDNITRIDVISAMEMLDAVNAALPSCDIFIGCAAVADYRLLEVAEHKLKKVPGNAALTLNLVENPDIIATVTASERAPFTVGFAAETRELARHAHDKLVRKRLDLIVANDVATPGLGFGADDNAAVLYHLASNGPEHPVTSHTLSPRPKQDLARAIIDYMLPLYCGHQTMRSPVCP